jgi:hypothetical protein
MNSIWIRGGGLDDYTVASGQLTCSKTDENGLEKHDESKGCWPATVLKGSEIKETTAN